MMQRRDASESIPCEGGFRTTKGRSVHLLHNMSEAHYCRGLPLPFFDRCIGALTDGRLQDPSIQQAEDIRMWYRKTSGMIHNTFR